MPSIGHLSLTAAFLAVTAFPALAGTPGAFDEAQKAASARGVPVLLDFATTW